MFATMRLIDVWYLKVDEAEIRAAAERFFAAGSGRASKRRALLDGMFQAARNKDALKAASKLTRIVDGRRVFIDEPPVVQHVELPGGQDGLRAVFEAYRATMADNRREFLERYRFGDAALKVVGVGSVGTRCFVLVLLGRDEEDPLILQVKEATASVLEAAGRSQRVPAPRPACRRGPAPDAGHAGHLPGLVDRSRRTRLLLPPAVGHEGLRGHLDPAARGPRVLRHAVRPRAGPCPRPQRRRGGHLRVPGRGGHLRRRHR